MNKPYEYVLFKSSDPYQLPIKYYDTLQDIAKEYNYHYKSLSRMFNNNNIIYLGEYSIERFRKEE